MQPTCGGKGQNKYHEVRSRDATRVIAIAVGKEFQAPVILDPARCSKSPSK